MENDGVERRKKLKEFIKETYGISLLSPRAYQLDTSIMGKKDDIYEKIVVLYPDVRDLEFLVEQRNLLGDNIFIDEYIKNPRDDLDQILPSRKKASPSIVDEVLEKLSGKYAIILHKDTTAYDKWKISLEKDE